MKESERIEKAKFQLLLDYPFYGFNLIYLNLIEDTSIETACTNGVYIKYNPEFTKTLSLDQIKTLLVHEVDHINFMHHLRQKTRSFKLWNEACDYAINYPILYEYGFKNLDLLVDHRFRNKSAEQIYKELENEKSQEENKNSRQSNKNENGNNTNNKNENEKYSKKSCGVGGVEPAPPNVNVIEETEKIKERIIQSIKFAEKAGKYPQTIKRNIDKLLKPKIPWERLLANWFNEKSNQDYTWLVRDNRVSEFYFPSLNEEELPEIAIIIDVSGSINQTLYTKFISEVNGLRRQYKFNCTMIACNTKVTESKKYNKTENINFRPTGRGGTLFQPAIDFVKDKNIRRVIYFTDMYSSDLQSLNMYNIDVLWLDYGRKTKPPCGSHIHIKGD